MNINMDNLSFCGAKEVMYALERASISAMSSQKAKTAERAGYHSGCMKAYMDMALKDDTFNETIKHINENSTDPAVGYIANLRYYLSSKKAFNVYSEKLLELAKELGARTSNSSNVIKLPPVLAFLEKCK